MKSDQSSELWSNGLAALENNTDINVLDGLGRTPIDHCARDNNEQVSICWLTHYRDTLSIDFGYYGKKTSKLETQQRNRIKKAFLQVLMDNFEGINPEKPCILVSDYH